MRRSLAVIAACLFFITPARAETITIVADIWCPYNCEPGSEHPGFMIEIAKKAFAKHGIDVRYITMPWTRAIKETRVGKYTAIVGASQDDAPDFVFPDTPQGFMRNKFYVPIASKWRFSGMPALDTISFGAIIDYSYNDDLDRYIKKHRDDSKRVQLVSGDEALKLNVEKLLAGRVGAVIEDAHVMSHHLSQTNNANKIKAAGDVPSSKQDKIYIAFSPKNPQSKHYAEVLSKEIMAMRRSGELKTILYYYMVSDWQ